MSKLVLSFVTAILLTTTVWAEPTAEQPDRNIEEYNLENKLNLKGFDPVAYFTEDAAIEGDPAITVVYGGVSYNFSSEANKAEFLLNPTKYEPTYGGWCAWAMANDEFADIDPTLFTKNGNRMHFFINRGAKAKFDRELELREAAADTNWTGKSGEQPRK